jgi:uncharacterized protein YvpB
LKKLCLLVSIFPLFGCSNSDETTVSKTDNRPNYSQQYEQVPSPVKQKTNNQNTLNLGNEKGEISIKEGKHEVTSVAKKDSIMLDVVQINQNPELRYGCEVTSLAMVLNYAGVKTNKMDLYRSIQKDPDPLQKSNGNIISWGNPADGFVGDMTGKQAGYAVFDLPMIKLINQKLPGRAVNLTNQPFEQVLEHVSAGFPVVVWTTGDYRLPDRWEQWNHGQQVIKTPLDLHAVVLVGYDANYVYLNDPLSGKKQVRVEKERFISSWKALNSRAVSYK